MRLSIPDDPFFELLVSRVRQEMGQGLRVRIVAQDASPLPDIAMVKAGGNTVTFHINDNVCRAHGLTEMYYPIYRDPTASSSKEAFVEQALAVIRSAADFYFHLGRYPRYNHLTRSGLVRLESYELEEGWVGDDWGMAEKEPSRNLIQGGVLNVYEEEEKVFGFKVINGSSVPLYAALFFFDMSDLSISQPPLFSIQTYIYTLALTSLVFMPHRILLRAQCGERRIRRLLHSVERRAHYRLRSRGWTTETVLRPSGSGG